MARDSNSTNRSNDDGSTHHTRYSDGSHRSYDRDESGNKSNDHFTDHNSGKHYYSQDTDDGKHKSDDVTDSKGNNVNRPDFSDFDKKHESSGDNDGSSGGGCFITTATLNAIGKEDGCKELNVFREFRDNWLVNQFDGKLLISEYYKIAPKIVDAINSKPDCKDIYQALWANSIQPCFYLIERGSFSEARSIYYSVVSDLKEKYISQN